MTTEACTHCKKSDRLTFPAYVVVDRESDPKCIEGDFCSWTCYNRWCGDMERNSG